MVDQLLLYFDGRCAGLGTPGALATYGWLIQHAGGEEVVTTGKGIASRGEEATANVGEYVALIAGLQALLDLADAQAVEVRGDSQLVVRQMTGQYGCYAPNLVPLHEQARALARHLLAKGCTVTFRWIPRAENAEADELSKRAYAEARAEADASGDVYAGGGDPVATPIALE